jgi:hypothetical protein
MPFLRALLLGLILVVPQGAVAQQREIFDLFGGMIRSGIAAATQAEWQRLPNAEVACIDGALRQRGSSINEVIRQGMVPSDPRMAGLRSGCRGQANNAGPSFDCRRARFPDEFAVCADPELSRLDRLIGQGYQDLLGQIGEGPARAVAAPLLASRRACGADVGCIRNAQLGAIRELERRGAAIADPAPAAETPPAQTPMPDSPYVVDGLHLGGHVMLGSPDYQAYRCNPSEQFTGLTWCQRKRQEMSPRGAYGSTTTILHSADGTALYINRYLEPAFFAGNEAMDDIRRLAAKYGEPHYVTAPAIAYAPRTLMVTWGDVVLKPLDPARTADLRLGRDVRAGILLDHIGNFQRSTSMGLPVYQVTGGPGYVWAASWDQAGRGTLRFLTIDASRLAPGPTPSQSPSQGVPDDGSVAANANAGAAAAPAAVAAPPAPLPAPQPSPMPAAEAPSAQPAPQSQEAVASPPAPAAPKEATPTPSAKPAVIVSQAADPAPPSIDARPAEPKAAPKPAPASADPPAKPRIVGPPIAIQPVEKTADANAKTAESNVLQWALVAVVVALLGVVGLLLFERRKRLGPLRTIAVAPASVPAPEVSVEAVAVQSAGGEAIHMDDPAPDALAIKEPPPALPMALPEATTESRRPLSGDQIEQPAGSVGALQGADRAPSSAITGHRHFGIALLVVLVTLSALTSVVIGAAGLIPLALAIYLLPTIIAFKVRHHYAFALALINVVFGFTVLGWLGIFVWALIGPRKSALDGMSQHSALGLAQAPPGDPALAMSDADLRAGWKMPVTQAEIFSFGDGAPVASGDAIKVFFRNPVIAIWRTGAASPGVNSVRYNAATQIRCVAPIAAETKLRVGRTLGRTALTGIGAAILTGRQNALGAAFLDYRFGGDETDQMIAARIVLSDYSSLVIQSEREEFEKFCALLPPHILSEEVEAQTAEEIDRIRRMAADGPRVIDEMRAVIAETEKAVATFGEQATSGRTFAERDEGRMGLAQAEERLANERAVLNAVDRLIRLATNGEIGDRQIA